MLPQLLVLFLSSAATICQFPPSHLYIWNAFHIFLEQRFLSAGAVISITRHILSVKSFTIIVCLVDIYISVSIYWEIPQNITYFTFVTESGR